MACDECDGTKTEAILVHEAETARLRALTDFLCRFSPAIGETAGEGYGPEIDCPLAIAGARDHAIREAFQAVAAIARVRPPAV